MDEEPPRPRRGPPPDPRLLRASPAVLRYIVASVTIGTASAILLIAQAVLLAQVIAREGATPACGSGSREVS
jgi:hypothetical protein